LNLSKVTLCCRRSRLPEEVLSIRNTRLFIRAAARVKQKLSNLFDSYNPKLYEECESVSFRQCFCNLFIWTDIEIMNMWIWYI